MVQVLEDDSIMKAVEMMESAHRVLVTNKSLIPKGIVAQIDVTNFLLDRFDFWSSLLDIPLHSPSGKWNC